jgi:hypothetical protein
MPPFRCRFRASKDLKAAAQRTAADRDFQLRNLGRASCVTPGARCSSGNLVDQHDCLAGGPTRHLGLRVLPALFHLSLEAFLNDLFRGRARRRYRRSSTIMLGGRGGMPGVPEGAPGLPGVIAGVSEVLSSCGFFAVGLLRSCGLDRLVRSCGLAGLALGACPIPPGE